MTATATATEITKAATGDKLKFQVGANENQAMFLGIEDMRAAALGIVGTSTAFTSTANVSDGITDTNTEKALDVSNHAKAAAATTILDKAIKTVSSQRAYYR
jgi:flagellin